MSGVYLFKKEIQEDIAKKTTIISKVVIHEREPGDYYFKVYLKGYKHMLSVDIGVHNGCFYMHQFNELITRYKPKWYRGKSYYYHEEILQQLTEILKKQSRFRLRLLTVVDKDYLLSSYKEKTFDLDKIKVKFLT